jgi:hypothetical protein
MARLPDGGLVGVRTLRVLDDGRLQSPQRQTVWTGPSLTAQTWTDTGALRDECGVHAIWPGRADPRNQINLLLERIRQYRGCVPDCLAVGVVAGYGRYVAGEDGWRAEQQVLQAVFTSPKFAPLIARRYPDVPVEALL